MYYRLHIIVLLSVVLFFSCNKHEPENNSNELKVEKLAESVTSWNGDTLPDYLPGQPKVTVLRINIPPHYKLEWHKHPVINAGVVLNGELTVISEKNDTLYLKPNDALVELVNTYHYGINEGDEPVDIIVFYAGNDGVPVTIKKE